MGITIPAQPVPYSYGKIPCRASQYAELLADLPPWPRGRKPSATEALSSCPNAPGSLGMYHGWEWLVRMVYKIYMGISKNNGTPKSSILIGFSIRNHPFWGTTIFGNTHIHTWGYTWWCNIDRLRQRTRESHIIETSPQPKIQAELQIWGSN